MPLPSQDSSKPAPGACDRDGPSRELDQPHNRQPSGTSDTDSRASDNESLDVQLSLSERSSLASDEASVRNEGGPSPVNGRDCNSLNLSAVESTENDGNPDTVNRWLDEFDRHSCWLTQSDGLFDRLEDSRET